MSSDFKNGGLKIANMINRLSYILGSNYTDILICDGPNNNVSARIRSEVIVNNVLSVNKNNVSIIDISTLDSEKCSDMIIDRLRSLSSMKKYSNGRCMIIYCGNDNVAIATSKKIRDSVLEKTFKLKFKKCILIGYDGLKTPSTGNYSLDDINFDYISVDVIPIEQGKYSAECLLDFMKGDLIEKEKLTDYEVTVFEDSNHVAEYALKKGYMVIGIAHKYNYNSLKSCSFLLDSKYKKGLFVGLCGIDIVYETNGYPVENMKMKTNNYSLRLGGPALNAAIQYSKLGGSATLVCEIGNHPTAKLIRKILEEYNIEIIDISNLKEIPNISCVILNRASSSRTIFSGQSKSNYQHVNISFAKEYDFCLYDCNIMNFTKDLIDTLKNYEIPIVLDCGSWKENIDYAIKNADVIISSEHFTNSNGDDIFALTQNDKLKCVAKTRGEKSILFRDNVIQELEIEKVQSAFTLGAGDVFHGAFCYFLFQ